MKILPLFLGVALTFCFSCSNDLPLVADAGQVDASTTDADDLTDASPDSSPDATPDASDAASPDATSDVADAELPCEGPDCPMTVPEWKVLFDQEFSNPRRPAEDCEALSTSTGANQEHYFFAYCIDGLVSMWRATGDNTYLDTTLRLIENTVADAKLQPDGFRYWPGPNAGSTYPLWDSYYWRMVTHLLRVMNDSPALLATADYQARFDALLEFSTKDIWEKWLNKGAGNLYRSRTHMASHWARIGMDLFLITGDAKYREVFDNISHGTMVGYPSNLRDQFADNPDHPGAYTWSQVWGASPSESIQDTSHAGAIVSFINAAADQQLYWTDDDVTALIKTLLDVIWDRALDGAYHQNVDGTDPTAGSFTGPYGLPGSLGGRLHEWLHLGSHDPEIQRRIELYYLDPARRNTIFFGYQAYGIGALNARILAEGAPVY